MAVQLTTVQGKILLPGGGGEEGTIEWSLSTPGSAVDGTFTQWIFGADSSTVASDGTVAFDIVPNDAITPANSYYLVTIKVGTVSKVERWNVDSSPDPVDVGAITRLAVSREYEALVLASKSCVTAAALPTAGPSFLGVTYHIDTGSGETASYVCHRTAAGTYRWVSSGGPGVIPDYTVSVLPTESLAYLFLSLMLDTGSGETTIYQGQRNADGDPVWVQASTGGSA